jgi:DNA-binding LytR/AlgR family response regulator
MRILIVDDEPAARRRLGIMLDELDVEVVGQATDGVDALEKISERKPDVVLLDLAMPEVDGFDVARHLTDPKPLIIFQTAYDEYALHAFEHEAVDYVVKPVTLKRLRRALDRARERVELHSRPSLSPELLERLQSVLGHTAPGHRPRLLVREGKGHRLLALSEIVRFTAKEGTVLAHSAAGRFFADYPLAELEDRGAGSFLRPNRSELVNVEHIHRIESNGDGSATLTLSDGTSVHVSRRRAADVRRALQA